MCSFIHHPFGKCMSFHYSLFEKKKEILQKKSIEHKDIKAAFSWLAELGLTNFLLFTKKVGYFQ